MVIISHKHQFIYIKTRKTASTSIQVLLEKYCGKDDILTPLHKPTTQEGFLYNKKARNYKGIISLIKILKYQIKSQIQYKSLINITSSLKSLNKYKLRLFISRFVSHMSAEKVKIKVGTHIWNNYFKFTFERNPWDKAVSSYYRRQPKLPFNEWVKTFSLNLRSQPLNFPLYSINGKNSLDFVGKYENLHGDLKIIFEKLNLPLKNLPQERVSGRNKDNYRNYYNENSKKIIERFYKKEIELMGYSF